MEPKDRVYNSPRIYLIIYAWIRYALIYAWIRYALIYAWIRYTYR